jgi:hypothetical protein
MTISRCTCKGFRDFTRANVIRYLDQFRKDEDLEPSHKWIGTYNTNLINVIRFFRWLSSPDLEPDKRPKPAVVQKLPKFRRRDISGYKPSDMWTPEQNLLPMLKAYNDYILACYWGQTYQRRIRIG